MLERRQERIYLVNKFNTLARAQQVREQIALSLSKRRSNLVAKKLRINPTAGSVSSQFSRLPVKPRYLRFTRVTSIIMCFIAVSPKRATRPRSPRLSPFAISRVHPWIYVVKMLLGLLAKGGGGGGPRLNKTRNFLYIRSACRIKAPAS